MKDRRPLIADQGSAVLAGVACYVLAAYLLWDAFEGRGRHRPFASRVLSGWV